MQNRLLLQHNRQTSDNRKTCGASWDDCLTVESVVAKTGVKTCVCLNVVIQAAHGNKGVIDNGLLGHIHYGEVDYYHGVGPWYGQYRWNVKKDAAGSVSFGGAMRWMLCCCVWTVNLNLYQVIRHVL